MKKNLLITGGGTAIAWHLSKVCNEFFSDKVNLIVTDINDEILVPSAIFAKKYYKTPFASDENYFSVIKKIILYNNIDIVIPIIPREAELLSSDSDFIISNSIVSAAPDIDTFHKLSDKNLLFDTLKKLNIPTPKIYKISEIEDDVKYFVKPANGFGSQGTGCYLGREIMNKVDDLENKVIQEYCMDKEYKEATVEIYNDKDELFIFARERVSTKAGVCVKTIPIDENIFYSYVKKLVSSFKLPYAFNVQFLYHNNSWKLFDCNLRLGAGTPLATAAGFQLTKALIAKLLGEKVDHSWFKINRKIRSILRVYDEVVIT